MYSFEELIAEMGAAFLCAEAGISRAVLENQAAYIQGWRAKLRSEKRMVVSAAAQAQKAADYILNVTRRSIRVAAYRTIAGKYPKLELERILRDLVASTPGDEGKWFAAAKEADSCRWRPSSRTNRPATQDAYSRRS
jgi:hypothetical protein